MTITNGVGAVAVTYSFDPGPKSPFITGGLGYASWVTPFESNSSTWTGFGFFVGGGYEFTKHWSVEADLQWGKPGKDEFGTKVSSNALAVVVTVNVLGY